MSVEESKSFKTKYTLEKRKTESKRIRIKNPDRVALILERAVGSTLVDLDKKKYLVPNKITVGQFLFSLRKKIHLNAATALFVFVNRALLPPAYLMSQAYHEYKDEDGFLYVQYTAESTFGALSPSSSS